MLRATFDIEDIRADKKEDDSELKITGYAAVFEKPSHKIRWFKEKIQKGAFLKSLKTNNIKALWNHNSDFVLASTKSKTLILSEDDRGLKFELTIPDTQAGKDAYNLVRSKVVDGMSFGFNVKGQIWDETNPKEVIRTLTEIDLHEVSLTAFPAYPQTNVKTRSIEDDYQDYKKSIDNKDIDIRKNELELKLKSIDL